MSIAFFRGVIALGDWPSAMDKIIGALALVLIILGVG